MKLTQRLFCKTILLVSIFHFSASTMFAQEKSSYSVAIFLYQNVELLDFAGPTEVFAATSGFKVFTVSVDGKDILSQGLLTVKPQYSIDNAPKADILIIPGGNSGPSANDPKVINWIVTHSASGSTVMSVCTGAFVLASAGKLENLNVTTHHSALSALQKKVPSSTVLENTRFVDNGNILTTAGVSAGIDGALHLVERIKGTDVAKATAHYMEYDKWNPADGKVVYYNPYLEKNATIPAGTPIPFEGELLNVASQLQKKNQYNESIQLIYKGIKWYPNSGALYNMLRMAYMHDGKPVPVEDAAILKMLDDGKFDQALTEFEKNRTLFPDWKIFTEDAINLKAYELMRAGKYLEAVKVFQLNVMAYPDSSNAWDSLAEGLMKSGNKMEAIKDYKKSLELDPTNDNAKKMLEQLEGMK